MTLTHIATVPNLVYYCNFRVPWNMISSYMRRMDQFQGMNIVRLVLVMI